MTKYKPLMIILVTDRTNKKLESPAIVVKVEGPDLWYRPVTSRGFGVEIVIRSDSDLIRPAPDGSYRVVVENHHIINKKKNGKFVIKLPQPEGRLKQEGPEYTSRQQALIAAQEIWKADSKGRIYLVHETDV